jgi:hypothetical protein
MGMTGKAPAAPCKRWRSGSIPDFSTGGEGDGNPPALGAGQTRFDSGVSDHVPLAQEAEHPAEARRMQVRFLRGAPCLTSIVAMRQSSKLVSGVQFSGEARKRCKHYGDAVGSYPTERGSIPWRRTGVYANAERPSSKGGGCEFESRRAYWMGYGELADPPGSPCPQIPSSSIWQQRRALDAEVPGSSPGRVAGYPS